MRLSQELPNGLLLRNVRDEADKEQFAALSATHNNPREGATCAVLLNHHPQMTPEDFWLVEDRSTNQVVSTICLIPWTCRLAGVDLRLAQLEMVLTHPDYRRQWLVRAQINQFLQDLRARDYDLGIVWGIPYYYRQYGFGYAIDGSVAESLPVWRVPDRPSADAPDARLRPATCSDIPQLLTLYAHSVPGLDIYLTRSSAYWEYLILAAKHPIQMLESASGEVLGYASLSCSPGRVTIQEAGLLSAEAALAFLWLCKGRVRQEIVLAWPQTTHLVQMARSLGSHTIRGGQWLLHVPDFAHFFRRMAPVLENRLAGSAWHAATTQLTINLFREAFRLRFENGKLAGVEALGFVDASMGADGGHLCIPPEAFVRLVCGYRSLDQLFDAWPDITLKPEARLLVEVLFPRMESYIHTPYHYLG
jgi:predicted N-acetyltransferase YhbS